MVAKAHFSSDTWEWATPQNVFDKLNEEFGFCLDAAATAENAKCTSYFTQEVDGLKQDWSRFGTVWVNPPYGRMVTGPWVRKGFEESLKGATVVMLLPSRTGNSWFQKYVLKTGAEVRFLPGRLKFGGAKNTAPFCSAVVVFRPVTK